MFDTLIDPWQLACMVLTIALVLAAGKWYTLLAADRDGGTAASDADTEA